MINFIKKYVEELVIILLILLMLAGGYCQLKGQIKNQPPPQKTHFIRPLEDPTNAPKIKEILYTRYVYQNSRIHKVAAEDIVNNVLRTTDKATLLLAIFRKESSYQANQTGRKTKYGYARGLGQVMWTIHKADLIQFEINNPRELFNPVKNIRASSFIVDSLARRKADNIQAILTGYYGARDMRYINTIMTYYHELLELDHFAEQIANTQRSRGIHGYDIH